MGQAMRFLAQVLAFVYCTIFITHLGFAEEVQDVERVLEHPNAPHLIYINYDGNLLHPKGQKTIAREDEQAYIDNMIQNFNQRYETKALKLVVFIHGGLNAMKGANERPDKFRELMLAEGYYPVFIGWNSGPWTNYSDHLFKVRKGNVAPAKAIITSPLYFLEDLTRSVLTAPSAYSREIRKRSSVKKLENAEMKDAYPYLVEELAESGFNIYTPDISPSLPSPDPLFPFKLVGKSISAPLVNGLGKGAWNSMLRRTDLIFTRPYSEAELLADKLAAARAPSKQQRNLAAQNFDTAAAKFFKTRMQQNSNVEIIVIGHSMGTLVANQIINRYPNLNIKHLVYMGAAAPMRDIENIVSPWLYAHPERQFYSLSLHPQNEIAEKVGYDLAPKGSLLNWIDHTFADIHSVKDRTSGSWGNMLMLADDVFLADYGLRQRVHLSKFNIQTNKAINVGPQKHGEFNDYPFWREEYWKGNPILLKPVQAIDQKNKPHSTQE